MFLKNILFLAFNVFVFCEAGFVDTLNKCKINDGDCQKAMFQSVLRDISKTGIPELKIPQLDPIKLKNVSVSIENIIDISMLEGVVKGIKYCTVENFQTNVEAEHAFVELTCDITVKGQYKVYSSSPIVKNFFGGQTVHGEGNGKIKISKLFIRLDFDFFVQRRDGELYMNCKNEKTIYSYDIKGNMHFAADKLYVGKTESSKVMVDLINSNWRVLMSSFGKPFMDKAMVFVREFLHRFFYAVPVRHYIIDDLSSYARDE